MKTLQNFPKHLTDHDQTHWLSSIALEILLAACFVQVDNRIKQVLYMFFFWNYIFGISTSNIKFTLHSIEIVFMFALPDLLTGKWERTSYCVYLL